MIQGISAIWLPVSDMRRAVAFYRDTGQVSEHLWGQIAPFKDPDGNDLQVYAAPSGS